MSKMFQSLYNKKNQKHVCQKGFTLIEILVVIGMIAILATIVIIAINPSRQFKQGRDTQRTSNINAILNAIGQRSADNKGAFSGLVGGTTQTCPNLSLGGSGALATGTAYSILNGAVSSSASEIDLSCLTPTYIATFPVDPTGASGADTGYDVTLDASGRVKISAPAAEIESSISVTR